MFSRLHSHLIILVLAAAAYAPSAMARRPDHLVLATSAEDPVLRARISGLAPTVNPEEAHRVAFIAYRTGRELAAKWDMVSSPTMQSFLINIGARKAGYCYQFAEQLLWRLEAQQLKTLEFHWGESDAGTDTEHNVIVVTARGQPFAQGIMLDNWRRSGRLLWGALEDDPDHTWQENKDAYNRRVKRRPPAVDRHKQEQQPKQKVRRRLKTEERG